MANPDQRKFDFGFAALVGLIAATALWLLLTPWVPSIASATMHRFHLRSESFGWWAIQQPIPSMYNFANQYEVAEIPPDFFQASFLDPIEDTTPKRYINHFPTRVITFANTRYRDLKDGRDRWYTFETHYRGQSLVSKYHAKAVEGKGFEIERLESTDQP